MKYLILILLILLFASAWYMELQSAEQEYHWPVITDESKTGLRPVDCWFGDVDGLSPVECYEMQVPENHRALDSHYISFPVMVLHSKAAAKPRPPLLHLGAGGPGAPMYLDDPYAIRNLILELTDASLGQGRDLILIDPRGTGLARPLLTCGEFVEGERSRLRHSLTLLESRDASVADYRACIDRLISVGVDHANYNSFAVARDIETLRQAAGIERWVLFGVSYGANYALTIANEYPGTVESMVLDSSFVSRIGLHERYIELATRSYRMLFNYCNYDPECEQPIEMVKSRFWALYQKLNKTPVAVELEYIHGEEKFPLVLDGERFLAAIMQGIYGLEIFKDLPEIITELENGEYHSLEPYLWLYVDFMLDPDWGDINSMAHYCYEEKPQIDFAEIRAQFDQLPTGYIQDTAEFFLGWPDLCEQMQINQTAPKLVPSHRLSPPTLFLHGRLDRVTPLTSVRKIMPLFRQAQLLIFDLGHGILSSSSCAQNSMAVFVDDPSVNRRQLECS